MFQNVSFVGTEVAAFFLAHPASVKKWRENVPSKVLRPSAIEIPEDEETRPSASGPFFLLPFTFFLQKPDPCIQKRRGRLEALPHFGCCLYLALLRVAARGMVVRGSTSASVWPPSTLLRRYASAK